MNAIIQRFEEILGTYDDLNRITRNIFNTLKKKELNALAFLLKEQTKNATTLEEKFQALRTEIERECEKRNITEKKLSALYPFIDLYEKEQIVDLRNHTIVSEQMLKNNASLNQRLLQILRECSESVYQTYLEICSEKGIKKSVFINRQV